MVSRIISPAYDPVRLSTSWLFSAKILALIRLFISFYIFLSIIVILAWRGTQTNDSGRTFSYFTSLTWWGLGFYFAFAGWHSWTYWSRGEPALVRWGGILGQLHSVLYSTITVFPFIVTIVYWALIHDYFLNTYETWSNTSQHALNFIFSLFEIFLTRADPLPWIHLLWLLILLALYVAVAYITVADQHFYVYAFLDDTKEGGRGRVTGYVFGILALAIVTFVVVRYLIWARKWVVERKLNRTGHVGWKGGADRQYGAGGQAELESKA